MKSGDAVIVSEGTTLWYLKTEEETRDLMRRDADAGLYLDSAGEPILYSKVGHIKLKKSEVGTILKVRGMEWPHWSRRPVGLIECFINVDGVPRVVMCQKKRCQHFTCGAV